MGSERRTIRKQTTTSTPRDQASHSFKMPKFFCDYCDVYLTHDSMSVRKAHNSGRNHLRNVVDYYQQIGHEKAQSVIDSITSSYAAEGQSSSNPMLGQNPGVHAPPPFPFPGGVPPPPFGMPALPGMPPMPGMPGMPPPNGMIPPPGGRGMPPMPPFPGGLPFPPPGGLPPNFQFPPPPQGMNGPSGGPPGGGPPGGERR